MMPAVQISGQRFGRLVVVGRAGSNSSGEATWHCVCDCGKEHVARSIYLRRGVTKSCGCLRREMGRAMLTSSRFSLHHGHGAVGRLSPTYRTWRAMIGRCTYPAQPSFKYCGARGITVCERWRKFENFLADMGERPEGKTIDRIDNDGNYEPGNCRWSTRSEQDNSRRPHWTTRRGVSRG